MHALKSTVERTLRNDPRFVVVPDHVTPDGWWFVRSAVFLRLLDWTGWTAGDLDRALFALGCEDAIPGASTPGTTPAAPVTGLTRSRMQGLAAMSALLERTRLAPMELFSWWTAFDLWDGRPADERLFDQRFLAAEVGSVFELDESRSELAGASDSSYVTALASALRVEASRIPHIIETVEARTGTTMGPNLRSVWQLFRWSSLAQAADLSVEEAAAWATMTGIDPLGDAVDPSSTLAWFEALDQLRRNGLTVPGAAWVFGHASFAQTVGPLEVESALQALRASLETAAHELDTAQMDERTLRAALRELGLESSAIDALTDFSFGESQDAAAAITPLADLVDLSTLSANLENADRETIPLVLWAALRRATLLRRRHRVAQEAVQAAFPPLLADHLEALDSVPFDALDFPDLLQPLYTVSEASGWSLIEAPSTSPGDALPAHSAFHLLAKVAWLVDAMSLDGPSLGEWLRTAQHAGLPRLSALPVANDETSMAGLWPTLRPALVWFGTDRRVPAAVRVELRRGRARTAMELLAQSLGGWSTAPLAELLVDPRSLPCGGPGARPRGHDPGSDRRRIGDPLWLGRRSGPAARKPGRTSGCG